MAESQIFNHDDDCTLHRLSRISFAAKCKYKAEPSLWVWHGPAFHCLDAARNENNQTGMEACFQFIIYCSDRKLFIHIRVYDRLRRHAPNPPRICLVSAGIQGFALSNKRDHSTGMALLAYYSGILILA